MKFEPPIEATVNWLMSEVPNPLFKPGTRVGITELSHNGVFVFIAGLDVGISIERFDFPELPEGYPHNAAEFSDSHNAWLANLATLHAAKKKVLNRFNQDIKPRISAGVSAASKPKSEPMRKLPYKNNAPKVVERVRRTYGDPWARHGLRA